MWWIGGVWVVWGFEVDVIRVEEVEEMTVLIGTGSWGGKGGY